MLDAPQGFVDQRQHGPVGIGLPEQKFLGVGVRSFVRKIHRRIVIRGPAFFLGPGNGLDQFLAPGLQFFLVIIQTLLIHKSGPHHPPNCRYYKRVIVGPLFTTVKEGGAYGTFLSYPARAGPLRLRQFRRSRDLSGKKYAPTQANAHIIASAGG
jgi:hypothetical protein